MAGGDTTSARAAIDPALSLPHSGTARRLACRGGRRAALTSDDALPRSQLEDHLPLWLAALADLLGTAPEQAAAAKASEEQVAEAHGLQRWQQGYDLREVMLEWACMHRVLVAELEHVAADPPTALLILPRHASSSPSRSAPHDRERGQVFRARARRGHRQRPRSRARPGRSALARERACRALAASRARSSRQPRRRRQCRRRSRNAGAAADRRENFVQVLRRNVTSLRLLLDDVTGLARLHAGQEQCVIAPYDAADLLRRLCNDVTPMAEAKGLSLKAEGPLALPVEGDAIKVRRVVQNLALNALKYTHQGGLHVTWGDSEGDDERWLLIIQDTGPGFHAGPGAPLAAALGQATAQAERAPPHQRLRLPIRARCGKSRARASVWPS